MKISQVHRLPGMRDVKGHDRRALTQAAESLRTSLGARGYEEIDTPLLEDAELFMRKSGGELTSRLYTFTEPGGRRVSLRPEFTSSIIRHLVQASASLALPVRWQYCGPVFRYEPGDGGMCRQFTQVGAELIGFGGVQADAEVLSLAYWGLQAAGLRGFRLRVGHLSVLNDVLASYDLSDRAKLFIIGAVHSLKKGATDVAGLMRQAHDVGLLRSGTEQSAYDGDSDAGTAGQRELIRSVLTGALSGPVGRRTPDEIVERLLRKVRRADDPDRMQSALRLVSELASVEGTPAAALGKVENLLRDSQQSASALDELCELMSALEEKGVPESQITLDFGLARGIAYYTGVIFELTSGAVSLCGGGRYDGLVKALGGDEIPAAGFAYTLDHVVDELERQSSGATDMPNSSMTEQENASSRSS